MDEIQALVHQKFQVNGFQRSGRTYNRVTPDGLIQVISFQLGKFRGASSLMPDMSGHFTINVGVYVPGFDSLPRSARVIQESFCAIRARFKDPARDADRWWDSSDTLPAATSVLQALDGDGLPFLARFSSLSAIADAWLDYADPALLLRPRWSRLRIAGYCRACDGDLEGARELIQEALAWDRDNATPQYVAERARKTIRQAADWGITGLKQPRPINKRSG